jgi:kinesin family member 11
MRALAESGTRETVPTGATPRKRKWEFAEGWDRAPSREQVLREWRARTGRSGLVENASRSTSDEPPPYEGPDVVADEELALPDEENEPEHGPDVDEAFMPLPAPPVDSKAAHTRIGSGVSTGSRPSLMPHPLKRPAGLPKSVTALAERPANVIAGRRRVR